ncbi:MAG TPA: xanthine dehydrogenase family protein subunit M [Vicinamibacteria bacterium]|nr:xanthine dehydrogenase family protein subunit M [Vicinamibacteria bacterium]
MLPSFAYVRAGSLDEAVKLLESGEACLHAGGSDLLGCLRDGVFTTGTVVSLAGIGSLRGVAETAQGELSLGALTTLAEVAAHPGLRERWTALPEAASQVGSPQLRCQGTLGGNLCQKPRCWYYRGDFRCLRKGGELCYALAGENEYHAIAGGGPCYVVHPSDTAPALMALGALVQVVGPAGSRTLPLEKLFVLPSQDVRRETALEPGEILTRVVLPRPAPGLRSTYRKVRARASFDFALVGAALALQLEGGHVRRARVVLSGVAPVPWPAPAVERALAGQRLDRDTIARAAEAATLKMEPLEKNAYKLPLLRGLVRERLEALAGRGAGARADTA